MPGIWMEHFLERNFQLRHLLNAKKKFSLCLFSQSDLPSILLAVAPGGVVYTFVWSTMLEHVFKVPLAFIQSLRGLL